jgi:4'-phosphopantetheinyl transferase
MKVYWLEQTRADVPPDNEWLSPAEADRLSRMMVPKRRDDWRLGRWTAKRAIADRLEISADQRVLAEIEVRPAESGAPEVYIAGRAADTTISLSHRDGVGLCAVGPVGVMLGCDLELIEPHSEAFIRDYFSDEEQAVVRKAAASERFQLLALLWSAKESALKALHAGLRLSTRSVSVEGIRSHSLNDWSPLQVHHLDGRVFAGWWRSSDRMVRTLVAEPPPDVPISVAPGAACANP